jgi:hypothetical protein
MSAQVSSQQWLIRRKDDTWTARREGVTLSGASEEDLREKLRLHVLGPYGDGHDVKLRRTWTVTVHAAQPSEEDDEAFVTSLFD